MTCILPLTKWWRNTLCGSISKLALVPPPDLIFTAAGAPKASKLISERELNEKRQATCASTQVCVCAVGVRACVEVWNGKQVYTSMEMWKYYARISVEGLPIHEQMAGWECGHTCGSNYE